MINIEEIKTKIIEIINQRGPVLPVHVSREINLSPTFASAILAELSNERRIKISNMKVGSSPLYFLPNQENQLENFLDNIEGIRKTALLKLKQNKILKDEGQEPAIRVALRSIRDFAIPLRFQEKIIWKYFTVSNNEAEDLLKKNEKPVVIQKHINNNLGKTPEHLSQKEPIQEKEPVLKKEQTKPKIKTTQKTEKFLEEIKNFLLAKDIELLKEISTDKKEITGITRINSDLGKVYFLMVAKDKKRITEADLTVAYQRAMHEKMPCLFISYGEPSKKTQEWLESYKNIIKIMKIG